MLNSKKFISDQISQLKKEVDDKAIIATSGGVDSTTAAVLVSKAIGKNLICVLVDTGYMRQDEITNNAKFLKQLGLNLKVVSAQKRFYANMIGVINPEKKRRVIGRLFIRIFEEVAKKKQAKYLIQG